MPLYLWGGKTPSHTLADILEGKSDGLNNIIYTETIFDFEATQSTVGIENSFIYLSGYNENF